VEKTNGFVKVFLLILLESKGLSIYLKEGSFWALFFCGLHFADFFKDNYMLRHVLRKLSQKGFCSICPQKIFCPQFFCGQKIFCPQMLASQFKFGKTPKNIFLQNKNE